MNRRQQGRTTAEEAQKAGVLVHSVTHCHLCAVCMCSCVQARDQAAAEYQEQLRQLSTDEALKASNQQLQEQLAGLQDQLGAATALQRSNKVRAPQAQQPCCLAPALCVQPVLDKFELYGLLPFTGSTAAMTAAKPDHHHQHHHHLLLLNSTASHPLFCHCCSSVTAVGALCSCSNC